MAVNLINHLSVSETLCLSEVDGNVEMDFVQKEVDLHQRPMSESIHHNAPLASVKGSAHPVYGIVLLESIQSPESALVDLQIKWVNEWMLTHYWSGKTDSLSGCNLTDLLAENGCSLPDLFAQLDQAGSVEVELLSPRKQWMNWRLTRIEHNYMAFVEGSKYESLETPQNVAAPAIHISSTSSQGAADLNTFFSLGLELHSITDRNGNILKVNAAWETLLGYSESELLGVNYLDMVHPDDKIIALAASPYLNPDQLTQRKRIRVRKKNGTYAIIEWYIDFVNGRVYGSGRLITEQLPSNGVGVITSTLSDETADGVAVDWTSQERTQVIESLRQSEKPFRAIFNLTYQFIGLLRPDGILLEVNETALQAGGLKLADVIGKPFWETYWWQISVEEQHKLKLAIQQAAKGELVNYEVEVQDANREVIALDTSIKPIFNEHGQVVLLIAEGRDITKKKRSENALRESEQRFREIAENVNDAFWVHSAQPFKLLYVNPAFERVVGFSAQQLSENPDLLMTAVVEEDQQRLLDIFARYRKGEELTGQYRLREANNMIRWYAIRTFISKDCQGNPLRYIGVASDITSQKEKELVLQQSLSREKELNKLKSQFVAIASHEFRTPLATIQSSVDLISLYLEKSEPMDQSAMRRHLKVIEKEILAFSSLLTDVLTIGRMEEGKITFKPSLVDVIALSEEVVSTHFGHHRDARTVRVSIEGTPYPVYADEKLIKHVLINLLTNAFKFSTDNPRLYLRFTEKKLIISVIDRGIGIPKEDIPSLFQPFFRAANATTIQGTGLGLAISRQFIELHGGQFTVSSEQNQGTTFTVSIPVKPS